MFNEFKKFIMRGNVLDMAVGVIIGAAFGKIVSSLVDDIIMPPVGLVLGGVDFSNLFINLSSASPASLAAARQAGLPVIAYGNFVNNVLFFIIQAFAVFCLIRVASKLRKPEPAPAPKRQCPFCRSEIAEDASRCPFCTSVLDGESKPSSETH